MQENEVMLVQTTKKYGPMSPDPFPRREWGNETSPGQECLRGSINQAQWTVMAKTKFTYRNPNHGVKYHNLHTLYM